MISVENISKTYGLQTALATTTLHFSPAKTTVLIGPSGCGKSTFLRILIGLIHADTGRVLIDGQELTPDNAEMQRRNFGYVIQDGGLFPHLTAERNVTLLARFLNHPSEKTERRVAELADLVQLSPSLLKRYPSGLSGGQRQRVGLMRALMLDPKILLLDEPLGALDPMTRSDLQTQLKGIFNRLGKTVVLVTHDMGEAVYLGDEIVLMRDGKILQRGTSTDLLERPSDPYVTEFIRAQRSALPPLTEVRPT